MKIVLIGDQEKTFLKSSIPESLQKTTLHFSNRIEGISFCMTNKPSLIIIDGDVSDQPSGLVTSRILKFAPETNAIPIFLISSKVESLQSIAPSYKVNLVMSRSIDPSSFEAFIKKHLGNG